ncbi:hypothetical protein BAE44_0018959 [Dichanthelium oligosanthes]|uniref:5'-3' DNA helicase ZGRF1-like N-terminal domain-containing protein n=1 Tax=Dichanthelium oligosanthes TaxID=888268 RepID=A0A1E5V4I7_9POAL|nr:hypothetical protein BAE44_0018959 [Dichanthelium oligosanthes]
MEAETPQRWAATYTKHLKQKLKAYHDGALLLYPASGRLVLLDDAGGTLESRFLRSSEEVFPGAALCFQAHIVDVGEPEDGTARHTSSSASTSAAGSRTARRGGGARARPPSSGRVFLPRAPRAFVNPSKSRGCGGGGDGEATGSGDAEVVDSRFQEWTVLYTAQVTQKAKKYHDGFVRLVQAGPHVKQIVLLDEDGQVLGSRHLKSGESIESGKKCHFPNYLIEICEAKNQNKGGEHPSEASMVHTRPKNGETTSNKMGLGASSKSQKYVTPQKFHDLDGTKSEVTTSSGKPETDKVEAVAAGCPGSLMGVDSGFKEWNALYTTQLTQKAKKYHDGLIRLMQIGSHARQIVLLDEYGEVLGNRYLKSVESVESGTKCQLLNYLVEVCELRNQTNETKNSLKGALNQTGLRNEKNTSDKTSEKSKSPKFISPFKFQDAQKSNWKSTASSNSPQIGKKTRSKLDAPQNFHVHSDLQRRKSHCNVNRGSDYSESTFGIVDDPLKFNGVQLPTLCLTLGNQPVAEMVILYNFMIFRMVNQDAPIVLSGERRPAAYEGQDLAMFDISASDMSNAREQKLDSSSQHTESSTEICFNISTHPGLQEDKSGSANQLSTQNHIGDGKCDGPTSTSAYTLTCKDPKIQELIDDCPSFDLGF